MRWFEYHYIPLWFRHINLGIALWFTIMVGINVLDGWWGMALLHLAISLIHWCSFIANHRLAVARDREKAG